MIALKQVIFWGIVVVGQCAHLSNRNTKGDDPDLGYPLTPEDIKYAHSKEYEEILKHQTLHDENTSSDMFEGDIALDIDEERLLQERGIEGLREVVKDRKWPKVNGLVILPYKLESGLTQKQRADIELAVEEYKQKTCVRLVPVTNTEEPFVTIIPDDKRRCYVRGLGMVKSGQEMGLATRCTMGNIIHEFMHALGHFHEHTRSDRDNYVDINTDWIDNVDTTDDLRSNFRHQYNTCTLRACQDLQVGYDYGSIMHYGKRSCIRLKDGEYECEETMTPKQSGAKIGQREGLSPMDIESIHERYGCDRKEVCIKIQLTTTKYAWEIDWKFGSCSSKQTYRNYRMYEITCCQPAGTYELECKDSYGDGWHGGSIQIGSNSPQYCQDFKDGKSKKVPNVTHG